MPFWVNNWGLLPESATRHRSCLVGACLRPLAEDRDYHSCALNVVVLAKMYLCLKIKATEGLSITLLSFRAFGHPIMLNSFYLDAELLSVSERNQWLQSGDLQHLKWQKESRGRKHFRQGCDLKEINPFLSLAQALLPGLQKSASFYWYSWKIKQLSFFTKVMKIFFFFQNTSEAEYRNSVVCNKSVIQWLQYSVPRHDVLEVTACTSWNEFKSPFAAFQGSSLIESIGYAVWEKG